MPDPLPPGFLVTNEIRERIPRPPSLPVDAFGSCRVLIHRVKKHLDDLYAAGTSVLANKTLVSLIDRDPSTGEDVYKIPGYFLPWDISAIAADAINNLRSALDHAFGATASVLGRDPKGFHFPFGENSTVFEYRLKRYWPDVPEQIAATLRSVRPFKTANGVAGNDQFWVISKLSNDYKHRGIAALATARPKITSIMFGSLPPGGRWIEPPIWHESTAELEFARVPAGAPLPHRLAFEYEIAFGEVDVLKGLPVCNTLLDLLLAASELARQLEEDARALSGSPIPDPPTA